MAILLGLLLFPAAALANGVGWRHYYQPASMATGPAAACSGSIFSNLCCVGVLMTGTLNLLTTAPPPNATATITAAPVATPTVVAPGASLSTDSVFLPGPHATFMGDHAAGDNSSRVLPVPPMPSSGFVTFSSGMEPPPATPDDLTAELASLSSLAESLAAEASDQRVSALIKRAEIASSAVLAPGVTCMCAVYTLGTTDSSSGTSTASSEPSGTTIAASTVSTGGSTAFEVGEVLVAMVVPIVAVLFAAV